MTRPTFLHIGLTKTGTTACQHGFDRSREALLEAGLLYPKSGIEAHHHFHVAQAFVSARGVPEPERRALLASLVTETEAADRPVLLSSEHFSDATEADIVDIVRFFGERTTIIVTLRNQIDWASATYAEAIRWGFRSRFEDFVERSVGQFTYATLLDRWAGVCGPEQIKVIPYDLDPGGVGAAILGAAGLETGATGALAVEHVHPRLSAPLVQLQYELSEATTIGQAFEAGLWRLESDIRRRGVVIPKNWRIPKAFLPAFLALDADNDRIADLYGLRRPLFGRTLAALLDQNQRQGYHAGSIAEWLIDAEGKARVEPGPSTQAPCGAMPVGAPAGAASPRAAPCIRTRG